MMQHADATYSFAYAKCTCRIWRYFEQHVPSPTQTTPVSNSHLLGKQKLKGDDRWAWGGGLSGVPVGDFVPYRPKTWSHGGQFPVGKVRHGDANRKPGHRTPPQRCSPAGGAAAVIARVDGAGPAGREAGGGGLAGVAGLGPGLAGGQRAAGPRANSAAGAGTHRTE